MKYALTALVALCLAAPVAAQTPTRIEIEVRTNDLNLATPADQAKLKVRIMTRMQMICGDESDVARGMKYEPGMLGARKKAYAACLSSLALAGTPAPAVQTAFEAARKAMGGK